MQTMVLAILKKTEHSYTSIECLAEQLTKAAESLVSAASADQSCGAALQTGRRLDRKREAVTIKIMLTKHFAEMSYSILPLIVLKHYCFLSVCQNSFFFSPSFTTTTMAYNIC